MHFQFIEEPDIDTLQGYTLMVCLSGQPMHACWEISVSSPLPSDAIWKNRSGSTLAQVMSCFLTAPSHYLKRFWLIIKGVLWHPPESNFTSAHELNPKNRRLSAKDVTPLLTHWSYVFLALNHRNVFKDYTSKIITISPRGHNVNSLWPSDAIWRRDWVNIGSGNGLLPDSTKPLPEPMLT